MFKKKKIIAVLFARKNSKRLKNKLLKSIFNTTLLEKNIKTAKKIKYVDKIIIATTTNKNDDKIVSLAKKMKVDYFRGSEQNVVDRFYKCIKYQKNTYDYAIRFCCDNYLTIPKLVEQNIRRAINLNLDIITPGEFAICTKGTSQVVISINCVNKIYKFAKNKIYKEHVENYCFENFNKFRIDYQIVNKKYYFKNLNFSIDESKQLNFILKNKIKKYDRKLFEKLNKNYSSNENFSKNKYSVDNGKFIKKNRIGYYYKSDFDKPRKKQIVNKTNKNYEFKKSNINKIFYTKFVDTFGNALIPSPKKNKFLKINFKNKSENFWNSYTNQKERVLCFRRALI